MFDLHANHKSQLAGEALKIFGQLYGVEREVADLKKDVLARLPTQPASRIPPRQN